MSSPRRAIYPGTFDPITNGHLDVVERALRLFDELIIAVARNDHKGPLFSVAERTRLVEEAIRPLNAGARLKVMHFDGLLVDFASEQGAVALIRGLRAVSDFEFEFQLALMNRRLNDRIETLFLMPKDSYTYLSSRIIKEVSRLGGSVQGLVPGCVEEKLKLQWSKP
jgi:pantetheine-phosphate adenylyltransferase